ncbi:hypothetical protein AB2L27_16225 [Kineococcus sp. LSe6-4]|uniref:ATP synthase protein I n=1 Tax=Kineococcus halophytocola TaxID=3234027 RepID=A0ABV4H6L6_9ACTN
MSSTADDVYRVVPRRSLPPVLAVGVACTLVGATAGWSGALGAAAGSVLAIVFLASTFWLLRILRDLAAGLSLAVALAVYLFKITTLATAVLVLLRVDALSARAVALAAAACTVAWLAAEVRAFSRMRTPVFVPPPGESRR